MPQELSRLYSPKIMELAARAPDFPRLLAADLHATRDSPLCGSRITVDLSLAAGRVSAYGHEVRACTLGTAAASLVASLVIGERPPRLQRLLAEMEALLMGAPPPDDRWRSLAILAPARAYKARHGSVLLPFQAIAEALDLEDGAP